MTAFGATCRAARRARAAAGLLMTVLLLSSAGAGHAQTLATGVLAGVVRDEGGTVLSDVALTVSDEEAGGSRSFSTGRDGAFLLDLLPPGVYTVLVERLGYRPKRIEAVPVQSGGHLRLEVTLTAAPPPVEAAEVVRFEAAVGGSRAGVSQALSMLRLDRLPWERREPGEMAGLSTVSTEALEVEGLPAALSNLMIDGVPYAPPRHPDLDRGVPAQIAFPIGVFQAAELVTADADIEWSGFAGGALSAHSRRGSSEFTAQGFGSWSGGPLRSSRFIDGSDVPNSSLWGGLLLAGPILPDTAHFLLGFEARRLETPRPRPWTLDDGVDAAVLAAGRDAYGVGLDAYTRPYVLQTTVATGFGRFDWQLGNDNALSVRAGFGEILPVGGDAEIARAAAPGAVVQGGDLMLSGSLSSRIRGSWAHEMRVGVTRGRREYEQGEAAVGGAGFLPSTRIVAGGLHFGADPRLPGRFLRTGFTTAQSLEIPQGLHRLKLGIETELAAHDHTYAWARRGEFVFGGPDEFAGGDGAFVQTEITRPQVSFTTLRFGAYLQDTWSANPDLRVVAGLRVDVETLPGDDVRLSQRWLDYTGLANTAVPARVGTLSPRLGLTWDVGGQGIWIVRATAATYALSVPPELLAELLTTDGTPSVRRGLGDLGGWPGSPGAATDGSVGSRLTLLGPDFRGPFTSRASFGVSHHLGATTTVHVSGTYRNTDFLPRRSDLNRPAAPTAHDQHGRPIYGPLVQIGQLVATPRPNRRFGDFDVVSAVNADGWSRYWGVTGAVEHDAGELIGLFARYTHSRTTDNWLARSDGGPDAQLTPFVEEGGADWREGRSDYDLPHRLAAGLELRLPDERAPRLAAVYRFRSGYPFTPGFRDGVDVNGDGSGRNDPAFVDESVSGVGELVSRWGCLRGEVGRFAERNSCRAPGVHALDLRLGLRLVSSPGVSAELFAEGLNLVESEAGETDRGLFLIDPSGGLVEDPARGVVTLPLVANPDFGRPLGRLGTGRTLRVGLQVTF